MDKHTQPSVPGIKTNHTVSIKTVLMGENTVPGVWTTSSQGTPADPLLLCFHLEYTSSNPDLLLVIFQVTGALPATAGTPTQSSKLFSTATAPTGSRS